MKNLLFLLALAAPLVASARLGETRAEMNARFGEPKFVGTQPVNKKVTVKNVRWHTKTMTIDAVELDGKMISETYHLMRRPWTEDEVRAARETQIASEPEKKREWAYAGPDKWIFPDRGFAKLEDAGRTLTFEVWRYNGKLNANERPESI